MPGKEQIQSQVEGLATLLVLDDEIRKLSNLREFAFFSTNETHRLIPYHTAYLWQKKEFVGPALVMQSGTAEIDTYAPTNQWIKHTINVLLQTNDSKKIRALDASDAELSNITANWPESLPPYLLWCPFLDKNNNIAGGLLLFRETKFSEAETKMLSWLISSYQYSWNNIVKPTRISTLQKIKQRPYLIAVSVIALVILFFPVRLSVLGTGTVTPKTPILINAPMNGTVKAIPVDPGDQIKKGQILISMDKTDLLANAEVGEKDVLLTKTKLRSVINAGFKNKESNADVPILQAQLAIDEANLTYTKTLLEKADVKSPINGIVIFDNKDDWIGQPVRTGERILVVAEPQYVSLKITVPVSDSIRLEKGASGEFFLYGALNPLPIKLRVLGYNAKLMPNHVLAYQLKADFQDVETAPQIGAQGTVKLYGHYVPFIYYLLRRPLQSMRQSLGI